MSIILIIALALFISFVGFLINKLKRGRMEKALGREVRDHELNSITSWMEVTDKEQNRRR